MTNPNTHANEGSAQPMPGLSKRAQEQLKPRKASAYSFAFPSAYAASSPRSAPEPTNTQGQSAKTRRSAKGLSQ